MSADSEPKATKRHDKISRSKRAEVTELERKISIEQSSLKRFKSDRTFQMWDLEPADRKAFKAETKEEVKKRKALIADLKHQRRAKKVEYSAEQRVKKVEVAEKKEAERRKKTKKE